MLHAFSRTELLLGAEGLEVLRRSKVAVFGIGGVGTFAVEALARAGVGHLVLVDHDRVCLTNLNRQLHSTHRSIGQLKVEAMRDRILDINPHAQVTLHRKFYNPGSADELLAPDYGFILDCIDTVTGKLNLIAEAQQRDLPIISCMGMGNKLDPTRIEVADISKTLNCPLARTMRKELRRRGIRHLKVVYSQEDPLTPLPSEEMPSPDMAEDAENGLPGRNARRQIPGSISFVPSVAGLIMAGEVIKSLVQDQIAKLHYPSE